MVGGDVVSRGANHPRRPPLRPSDSSWAVTTDGKRVMTNDVQTRTLTLVIDKAAPALWGSLLTPPEGTCTPQSAASFASLYGTTSTTPCVCNEVSAHDAQGQADSTAGNGLMTEGYPSMIPLAAERVHHSMPSAGLLGPDLAPPMPPMPLPLVGGQASAPLESDGAGG
eukprot:scaffold2264_cov43-Tisochrysis_lutea.AAC.5